jgi:hypothetical protein
MKAPRPSSDDARLQLVPASGRSRAWLALLSFVLPLGLGLLLPRLAHHPGYAAHWLAQRLQAQHWAEHWIGAAMLVLLLAGGWLALDALLRRHRLRLDGEGIDIATTLYTRRLRWQELDLETARVIDLDEHPESRPLLKTNGYALPGFRSGWFRARDFSRMFVAAAGGSRLLRIPTRLGYALLLQPGDPKALLERMRAFSATAATGKTQASPGR